MRLRLSRPRSLALPLALLLLTVGAACGPRTGGGVRPSRLTNVIMADEIAKVSASDAYDIVRQLRPAFLRTRGAESIQNPNPPTPIVYVDDVRFGELPSLRQIPASNVFEIRYLSAIDATSRFGTGHSGGAILVRTKNR